MSYGFSVKAASLLALLAAVGEKFDAEVVKQQPIHARDRPLLLATVEATGGLIVDKSETMDITASVSGSVSWSGGDSPDLHAAAVNVSVYWVQRE